LSRETLESRIYRLRRMLALEQSPPQIRAGIRAIGEGANPRPDCRFEIGQFS
jgi:hypothetical protein